MPEFSGWQEIYFDISTFRLLFEMIILPLTSPTRGMTEEESETKANEYTGIMRHEWRATEAEYRSMTEEEPEKKEYRSMTEEEAVKKGREHNDKQVRPKRNWR